MIMLENGIKLTTNSSVITIDGGFTFKPRYSPEFEKLFIFGDTFPEQLINERTVVNINQHYEYLKNVYEIRSKGDDLLNKRVIQSEGKKSAGRVEQNDGYETIYAKHKRPSMES